MQHPNLQKKKKNKSQPKSVSSLPKFSLMLIIEISALQQKHQSIEGLALFRGWSFGKVYWGWCIQLGDVAGTHWRWMLRVWKCKQTLGFAHLLPAPTPRILHCWLVFIFKSSSTMLSRHMCCFHRVGTRSYFFFQLNFKKGNKYSGFALKLLREEFLDYTSWLLLQWKCSSSVRVSAW